MQPKGAVLAHLEGGRGGGEAGKMEEGGWPVQPKGAVLAHLAVARVALGRRLGPRRLQQVRRAVAEFASQEEGRLLVVVGAMLRLVLG